MSRPVSWPGRASLHHDSLHPVAAAHQRHAIQKITYHSIIVQTQSKADDYDADATIQTCKIGLN
eukprot:scaffold6557_cov109-Skeletonema_dohrnii-CCMP3373.AAC.5